MEPYQQRVLDEHKELRIRLKKLADFFLTDTFANLPEAERSRLKDQELHMEIYATILEERIDAF